jgi:motility quorum-sensing regulator / GCU-specific mRNA interferase toxin
VDKRSPHYDLIAVQASVSKQGISAFTKAALDGGRVMGLTSGEMLKVVASLKQKNFYKSMTSYADHKIWHDVYHAPTPVGREAYIKVTVLGSAVVIQFKEK